MKASKYVIFLICIALMLPAAGVSAETFTRTSLEIHENTIVNEIKRTMFGVSSDWSFDYLKQTFYGDGNDMAKTKPEINKFFAESGFRLPLFRIGGGSANNFLWKHHLTKADSGVKSFGIPELLKGVWDTDPNARLSVTLNILTDTDDNLLDLVRFMTLNPDDAQAIGTDGKNWAEERIKRGIKEPFPVYNVVLGNELDWLGGLNNEDGKNWSAEKYISECNRIIPKIRAVNPNVKIGVFTKTATSGFADSGRGWDEKVIKALGPKVEYIVQHLYYHLTDAAYYEQVGRDYDNIESFISEEYGTSHCKIFLEEHGMYADWGNAAEYPRIMSFEGMMALSMFYCRRLKDSHFEAASFHGFSGENPVDDDTLTLCSEVVQAYKTVPYMLTGAGEILKFFYTNAGKYAVQSELKSSETGLFKDDVYNSWLLKKYRVQQTPKENYAGRYPSVNALVTTAENGGLNIFIANREQDIEHENISVSFENGPYRLKEKTVITADNYSANITAGNPEAVRIETTKYTDNAPFESFTVNHMEIVLYKLEPLNLEKTVTAVEIKNSVTKNYKEVADSPYRNISAACITTAADDTPITFRILKQATVAETSWDNTENTIAEAVTMAGAARNGINIKMPDTAKNGSYVLLAGNFENSQHDYAAKEFDYYTSAAENTSVAAVSVTPIEGGKIKVTAQINPENKFSKYAYMIHRGETAEAGKNEDLINIGQAERKGDFLKFEADMPKTAAENGTYTLFVGNGAENIGKCVFEYSYVPESIKEIYVNFGENDGTKITADISFSEGIPKGELFTLMLVKPGYNLVSNESDLRNIAYADVIENTGKAQSIEINLKKGYQNGVYMLMINGRNSLRKTFGVSVDGGADIFINEDIKNENGDIINERTAFSKIHTDIYSTEERKVSAFCAVYAENGSLADICVKKDFELCGGITKTEFDFGNIHTEAASIKIFTWNNDSEIKPVAKYVGVHLK